MSRRLRLGFILFVLLVSAVVGAAALGDQDDPAVQRKARTLRDTTRPSPTPHRARAGHEASRQPALTQPGSRASALPGDLLIADKGNNRLLEVDPHGHAVWRFPRAGDLTQGQTFTVPDDAFHSPDGSRIVATQEDAFAISVIDPRSHRITYRYGVPGVPGSGPDHLYNPDDAMMLAGGAIVSADIKNCRLLVLRPPSHMPQRQLGATGGCTHSPPTGFASPNGAFPATGGNTIVTEIGGDWIDLLSPSGRLIWATHAPGFTYPSDTNEVRPGVFLSVDYAYPGAIETFDPQGHVLWRYAPQGENALDHPSLALPLPNGDIVANDDYNDRVIVVDPHTDRIVWQYGHTGVPGSAPGYLNIPDGVDPAPPDSLLSRFPTQRPPRWPAASR
jgi:DNA-binding beta-propeller fold protein YncE